MIYFQTAVTSARVGRELASDAEEFGSCLGSMASQVDDVFCKDVADSMYENKPSIVRMLGMLLAAAEVNK